MGQDSSDWLRGFVAASVQLQDLPEFTGNDEQTAKRRSLKMWPALCRFISGYFLFLLL